MPQPGQRPGMAAARRLNCPVVPAPSAKHMLTADSSATPAGGGYEMENQLRPRETPLTRRARERPAQDLAHPPQAPLRSSPPERDDRRRRWQSGLGGQRQQRVRVQHEDLR